METAEFPFHYESTAELSTSIDAAFAHLDDFRKISAHMSSSSGMMLGSRMQIEPDEREGRAVGSVISMQGKVLGVSLSLREVVTERTPPTRKVWRTLATDLLVIGGYSMGFGLQERGPLTSLRVFIDYDLPDAGVSRWLGTLFGRAYARWCTETMVGDAVRHFAVATSASAKATRG